MKRRLRGFTLLEVIVALAVIAIALLALVRAAGIGARTLGHERTVTLATWVAADVLAETQLRERFPPAGRRDGTMRMGTGTFRWELVVQATTDPAIRRLDVRVFEALDERARRSDAAPVATLTGFAGE